MNGHIYTASFFTAGATALQDLFQLAPVTNPIEVMRIEIGQTSDAADAEAEMLQVQLSRTTLAVDGSGGSTLTPVAHSPASPAATTVVEANNTTQSTVTTVIAELSWNVQANLLWLPTPEEQVFVTAGQGFVVELPVGPNDALDISGSITFRELR